jgi:hypothetical protein
MNISLGPAQKQQLTLLLEAPTACPRKAGFMNLNCRSMQGNRI